MSTLSFKYRDERSILRKPRTRRPDEFDFFSSDNEVAHSRALKNAIRDQKRASKISEHIEALDKKDVTPIDVKISLVNDFSEPITKHILANVSEHMTVGKKINPKLKNFFTSIEDAIENPDTRPTSDELYFLFGTILKKEVKNRRNGQERVGRVTPELKASERRKVDEILTKMGIGTKDYDELRKKLPALIKNKKFSKLRNTNSNREFFYSSLDLMHAKLSVKKSVDPKTAAQTRNKIIEKFCKDINSGLKGEVISRNLTPMVVEQLLMPADAIGDFDLRNQKKYNIKLNDELSKLKKELTLNNCQNVAVQIDMGTSSREPLVIPRILLDITNRANTNVVASYYTAILKLNSDLDDIEKLPDEKIKNSRVKEYYAEVALNPYKAEAFSEKSMKLFRTNLIMNKLLEATESYIDKHPLSPSATNSSLDWLKTTDPKNAKKFSNIKFLAETAGTLHTINPEEWEKVQEKYRYKFIAKLNEANIDNPKLKAFAEKFYPTVMDQYISRAGADIIRRELRDLLKHEGVESGSKKIHQITNVLMYVRKQIMEQYLKDSGLTKKPIIGLAERDGFESKISRGIVGQERYLIPHDINIEVINFAKSEEQFSAKVTKMGDFTKEVMKNPYVQITLGKNVHQYKKENFDKDNFTLSQRAIEGTSLMLKKELSTLDAKGKGIEKEKLIKSFMDTFVEIGKLRKEMLSLDSFGVASKNRAKKILELAETAWFGKIEASAENFSKKGKYGTIMSKDNPSEYKSLSLFMDVNERNSEKRIDNLIKVSVEEIKNVLSNKDRADLDNNAKDYALRMAYQLQHGSKKVFNPVGFADEFSGYSRTEQLDFLKKYVPLKADIYLFGDIIKNLKKEDSTVYKVLRDELVKNCTNENDIREISTVITADRVRTIGYSINRLTQSSLKLMNKKEHNPMNSLMDGVLFEQEFGNKQDYRLYNKFKSSYNKGQGRYYEGIKDSDPSRIGINNLKRIKTMLKLSEGLSCYRRADIDLKETKLSFYDKALSTEDKKLSKRKKSVSQKDMN